MMDGVQRDQRYELAFSFTYEDFDCVRVANVAVSDLNLSSIATGVFCSFKSRSAPGDKWVDIGDTELVTYA
jgi:hypothetical protein